MPTALAEVLAVAVSTAAGLAAAGLTGAVSSTRVFSAGMGASIRATMDTGLPRTVIMRSTVRPPATDQIWLAILNRAALARDQCPALPAGLSLSIAMIVPTSNNVKPNGRTAKYRKRFRAVA
jgi:hypothetical protein